jgi:isocitrate dehydrogenase
MVIFGEHEDIYAGIEFEAGSGGAELPRDVRERFPKGSRRFLPRGLRNRHKACRGREAAASAPRSATPWSTEEGVTFVHKGNIMKFTEGAFRGWATRWQARSRQVTPWGQWGGDQAKKGGDAANAEQKAALASGSCDQGTPSPTSRSSKVLTRLDEFDVIATLNLNGDT